MRRNPFTAIAAAARSIFGAKPKTRTVTLTPSVLPGSDNRARLRWHSKHSAASLPHRRHWRPARRAALSLRWSRVMAQVRHPVASMWRAFSAASVAPLSAKVNASCPGWKSWKKRARAAVSR